jgi:hypothetical protein
MLHGEHFIQYLKGLYHFYQSDYEEIYFSYDDGRAMSFGQWADGMRYVWQDTIYVLDSIAPPNNSEESFMKYMEKLQHNSTTIGLTMNSETIEIKDISVGDVLIQPANTTTDPGHAVIVVDMAVNPTNGEKLVLLAQGYNPTQHMHILHNPYEQDISPWYRIDENAFYFTTAQWTFRQKHIKRLLISPFSENINENEEVISDDD